MPSGYSVIDVIMCVSHTHMDIMYAHTPRTQLRGRWLNGLDAEYARVWIGY